MLCVSFVLICRDGGLVQRLCWFVVFVWRSDKQAWSDWCWRCSVIAGLHTMSSKRAGQSSQLCCVVWPPNWFWSNALIYCFFVDSACNSGLLIWRHLFTCWNLCSVLCRLGLGSQAVKETGSLGVLHYCIFPTYHLLSAIWRCYELCSGKTMAIQMNTSL